MNWKKNSIVILKEHEARKMGLLNIEERIQSLREKRESVAATAISPIKGGGSMQEDRWINSISKEMGLELNYNATLRLVETVEKALTSLTPIEQRILDIFYINRPGSNYIETLENELHFSKTKIYELKDNALHNFTLRFAGMTEY